MLSLMSTSWLVSGLGRLAVWDLDRVPLSKNPFHTSKGIQSESKPLKAPNQQLTSSLSLIPWNKNHPWVNPGWLHQPWRPKPVLSILGGWPEQPGWTPKASQRSSLMWFLKIFFLLQNTWILKRLKRCVNILAMILAMSFLKKKTAAKNTTSGGKKTNLVAKFRRLTGKDSKRSNFGTVTPWNCGASPVVPKKQWSLYDTRPQTMHCYSRDIPQNCHRFLFFDFPKMANW